MQRRRRPWRLRDLYTNINKRRYTRIMYNIIIIVIYKTGRKSEREYKKKKMPTPRHRERINGDVRPASHGPEVYDGLGRLKYNAERPRRTKNVKSGGADFILISWRAECTRRERADGPDTSGWLFGVYISTTTISYIRPERLLRKIFLAQKKKKN